MYAWKGKTGRVGLEGCEWKGWNGRAGMEGEGYDV